MKLISITNRKLIMGGKSAFYEQIEKIALAGPDKIILREKDMPEDEYEKTALKCKEICKAKNVAFGINKFINTAKKLEIKHIHLSVSDFIKHINELDFFEQKGVSIHSVKEAIQMEEAGADYLIAGHIFKTDCKKDLTPRGTEFLKELCLRVSIPVYAIGGINKTNAKDIKSANADGICLMSSLMQSKNPNELISSILSSL